MDKKILITAAIMAITAIILGAFGAHKLKEILRLDNLFTKKYFNANNIIVNKYMI